MSKLLNLAITLYRFVLPPEKWQLPAALMCGIIAGLGLYTIYISKAFSYMSDKPEVCMNCHIMASQYASWAHSSHHLAATCNDCHVPHQNIAKKYIFKGMDGARHSFMFTFRLEPQVIHIKEMGKIAVYNNCIRCHEETLSRVKMGVTAADRYCWDCHRDTPHGRTSSLSAVPNARVPTTGSMVPKWLKDLVEKEKKDRGNKL